MRVFIKSLFIFFYFFLFVFNLFAQNNEKFAHNKKIYGTQDNWFTIGVGGGVNSELKEREINFNAAYNFYIKKMLFHVGYHHSADKFFYDKNIRKNYTLQQLNDIYTGYGFRSSKLYSNVAFFAGPSLAYGSKFHYMDVNGKNNYIGFTTLGAYTNFEFSYKISYDLGLGISIYTSISKEYHVYGFQFQLYFSSAFKKNIK
ncbi:MAG: hypothetical protein KAT68_17440 [Bacteroidales bacterium]|nr:hypothetical protein [Bacteroidales bacterium]